MDYFVSEVLPVIVGGAVGLFLLVMLYGICFSLAQGLGYDNGYYERKEKREAEAELRLEMEEIERQWPKRGGSND